VLLTSRGGHFCLLNMAGAKFFALAVVLATSIPLIIAFDLPNEESVLVIGSGGPGASQLYMRTFELALQQRTPECDTRCTVNIKQELYCIDS
jgi:hypothetical protein